MKALTLYQPWATLIAIGAKRVETRPWATRYRGPVAIHAGANQAYTEYSGGHFDHAHAAATSRAMRRALHASNYSPRPARGPFVESDPARVDGVPIGAIVATCELVDIVRVEEALIGAHAGIGWRRRKDGVYSIGEREVPLGFYTPGRFAWLLDDVEMLDPPIPARGSRQLWEWEGQ